MGRFLFIELSTLKCILLVVSKYAAGDARDVAVHASLVALIGILKEYHDFLLQIHCSYLNTSCVFPLIRVGEGVRLLPRQ